MATTTTLIKHITFLLLLLLFVLIASPIVNAMLVKDVHAFCKETNDVNFCLKYIGADKRISAARDLNDVLLIVFSQCKIQVTEATKHISKVRQKFSGPIGKERIKFCERNYGLASGLFQEAYETGKQKALAYRAHLTAQSGSDYVRKCEEEWKKNGPIQKSPVTFYNTNVIKLFSIIRVIISKVKT
ncbi:PREDICTED: uncharacterized protein LOC104738419 [Camelina sativa]|uniref:Uncharacterized protein LOC104738419 n=1 Tax=Camelina sativa TaxID=90675 RepID=A0ABM0VIW0_CAMSA|nr:PREDICTED: uncharacterized protein LOC104738419 [Camelina sativa]